MKDKRILLGFLLTLAVASVLPRITAGVPLTLYQYKRTTTGVTPHVFSATAKTFNGFTDGEDLSKYWLKADGTKENDLPSVTETEASASQRTGNIAFNVPFGEKDMHYIGITAGGDIYFGENDALYPVANPGVQMRGAGALVKNLMHFQFVGIKKDANGLNVINDGIRTFTATDTTQIRYEISGDTLFVGYENVKVLDGANTNYLTVSFQFYVAANGNMAFVPVADMKPGEDVAMNERTGAGCWGFTYGVYGTALSDCLFAGSIYYQYDKYEETCNSLNGWYTLNAFYYPKRGERYVLCTPAPCAAIAAPSVSQWGCRVGHNSVSFNYDNEEINKKDYLLWGEGNKALLVVSKKAALTGSDLPVNGTVYDHGGAIGSSVAVALVEKDGTNRSAFYFDGTPRSMTEYTVSGLEPNTDYYLHLFPYDDACSGGPVYNTTNVPKKKITTYLNKIGSVRIRGSEVEANGITLQIDNSQEYLIMACSRQISARYSRLLLENRAYTVGEQLTQSIWVESTEGGNQKVDYSFTVIEPRATGAEYVVEGLEKAEDYYFYVWAVSVHEGRYNYSDEFVPCAVSTLHPVPASIDFSSAEAGADYAPAGWYYGQTDSEDIEIKVKGNKKNLTVPFSQNADTHHPRRVSMFSPVFYFDGLSRMTSELDLNFWTLTGEQEADYKPQTTDSVIVQYREVGDDEWKLVSALVGANVVSAGRKVYVSDTFISGGKFQLCITFYSNYEVVDPGISSASMPYVSLYGLKVTNHGEPLQDPDTKPALTTIATVLQGSTVSLVASRKDMEVYYGIGQKAEPVTLYTEEIEISQPTYLRTRFVFGEDTSEIQTTMLHVAKADTVRIHDTLTLIQRDTVTLTVRDTLYLSDTVRLYDTLVYTVQDTLWLRPDTVILYDTIIITDTVYIGQEPTNVVESRALPGVNVYPNPCSGVFNVTIPVRSVLEVYDAGGRILSKTETEAGVRTCRLDKSGIYFIRVTTGDGHCTTQRLVVR